MGTHTCVGQMHDAGAPSSFGGEGGVGDVDVSGGASSGASGAPIDASSAGEGGNASQGGAEPGEATMGGDGGAMAGTSSEGDGGEPPLPTDREFAQWPMPNPVGSGYPHPAQYDTSKPDVVVDRITGLTWESNAGNENYKWADAAAKCKETTTGGYRDWRLPSRIELLSLVDFTRTFPAINLAAFPDARSSGYWTASPSPAAPNRYSYVEFDLGIAWTDTSGELHWARCVRGLPSASPPHYSTLQGYVRDNATGLNWEMPAPDDDVDYAGAVAHCKALTAGGFESWRLPSINELQTLVDVRSDQPAMDVAVFSDVDAETDMFWSSSPYLRDPEINRHWMLQDHGGVGTADEADGLHRVRCVLP